MKNIHIGIGVLVACILIISYKILTMRTFEGFQGEMKEEFSNILKQITDSPDGLLELAQKIQEFSPEKFTDGTHPIREYIETFQTLQDVRYGKLGSSNAVSGVTAGKWIKIASVKLVGAWQLRGMTLEVYPSAQSNNSSRQTLVCLVRNGADNVLDPYVSLTTHNFQPTSANSNSPTKFMRDVRVLMSGVGVNNTMDVYIQFDSEWMTMPNNVIWYLYGIDANDFIAVTNQPQLEKLPSATKSWGISQERTPESYSTSVDGRVSYDLTNRSNGASAHTLMSVRSDAGGAFWFINGTKRTADGGASTSTIRNDAGGMRVQSRGGKGMTVQSTTGYAMFDDGISAKNESQFHTGKYEDPEPGVRRAIKIGQNGMAVKGGIKTDSLKLGRWMISSEGDVLVFRDTEGTGDKRYAMNPNTFYNIQTPAAPPPETSRVLETYKWEQVDQVGSPMTKTKSGDVACLSKNGKDCEWNYDFKKLVNGTPTDMKPEDIQPLVCGDMHKKMWGGTGYDAGEGSWCNRGKKHFAPEVTQAEYEQMWKDAGCTTKPYYGPWSKQQSRQTLVNDTKAWATLTDDEHRRGCYGDDKTKWPSSYTVEKGIDWFGNDRLEFANATTQKCETECSANDWCVGFAFDPNNKYCWLKQEFAESNKRSIATIDTYKKPKVMTATVIPDTRTSNGTHADCSLPDSKIDGAKGWCASTPDVKFFMEFDLGGSDYLITQIKMQSRNNVAQWIRKFQLWYVQDSSANNWVYAGEFDTGITKTNETKIIPLNLSATARKVRIHANTWNGWPSARIDFVGFKSKPIYIRPAEGQSMRCAGDAASVYRYEGGKYRWFPNPTIAASWDANWANARSFNCEGLTRGTDMAAKFVAPAPAPAKAAPKPAPKKKIGFFGL